MSQTKVHYVDNLSCANCAKKFENNLKALPNVEDAQVNFMAAKITIHGSATVDEIEEAGAFDHIKVKDTDTHGSKRKTLAMDKDTLCLILSTILIIIALALDYLWNAPQVWVRLTYMIAILLSGYELFLEGLKNLRHLTFDMTTLMTISITGAAIIGEWQEAAIVVILFAISEFLEKYSMDNARQSLSQLMSLAPDQALVLVGNQEVLKPISEIQVGDILSVKPGQRIAMDGQIIEGTSAINQAAITGESVPVTRTVKDDVYAGTLNEEGYIKVLVSKSKENNTLSKIIQLVEDAQNNQSRSQSFVDKFAEVYTPIIMLIAFMIMVIPPVFFNQPWQDWIYQGLAILIIGCPCALVISTPVAIVTAIGNAAKQGILIKGGNHLENLGHTQVVAFDKTGTLTQGKPTVQMMQVFDHSPEKQAIFYQLEKATTHPLAMAITKYITDQTDSITPISLSNIQTITGQGVKGVYKGHVYYAGSLKLFEQELGLSLEVYQEVIDGISSQGMTIVMFGSSQSIDMIAGISDTIRPHLGEVMTELTDLGIETLMLTGDNAIVAHQIGQELGISSIKADQMPEDKLREVQRISQEKAIVMVGDGVNDAPALATATVGVSMGTTATDTALETADVALVSDDLLKLPYSIRLSRKTLRIIKQNISFALGLKILALILVIPGWLTLWMAIFSDIGATILVIFNSLRLLKGHSDYGTQS